MANQYLNFHTTPTSLSFTTSFAPYNSTITVDSTSGDWTVSAGSITYTGASPKSFIIRYRMIQNSSTASLAFIFQLRKNGVPTDIYQTFNGITQTAGSIDFTSNFGQSSSFFIDTPIILNTSDVITFYRSTTGSSGTSTNFRVIGSIMSV